jgi:hypothetical protein
MRETPPLVRVVVPDPMGSTERKVCMKAIQLCLFGPDWEEEITFYPEKRLVGEERLKNKVDGSKRLQEAQDVAEQLMLPIEDEKLMDEAWPG